MNRPQKREQKPGRNDPCACGSSKKYKQCCLWRYEEPDKTTPNEEVSLSQALQIAISHHQAERLQQAEVIYRRILQVNPKHADALHLSGVIAYQKGELNTAVELIKKAISLSPLEVYYNSLGAAFRHQGKLDLAVENYRKAILLKPTYAEAYNNLGIALREQNILDEAIECYRKAISIKPAYAEAYNNLGVALRKHGILDEAIECYRKTISIKPVFVEAYNNLGIVLREQDILDEAAECYRKVFLIKPDYPDAHNGLGILLMDQGKQEQALSLFEKGLAFNPSYAPLHHSLIFSTSRGYPDAGAKVFELSKKFGKQFETGLSRLPHKNDATCDRRLRIGYVSGDFRQHSVAYFIEPTLKNHDKRNIEIYCYYNHHRIDHVTRKLMGYSNHWRSISDLSDEDAAKMICQDGIDILVDLSGHTAHNRLLLFARKPAPVQVTCIGYPATTGLSAMDYRLTNNYIDPPGWNEAFHTEKLVRLSTSTCFQPEKTLPEINALPALKKGYLTFASFHAANKITAITTALWAKVLLALPNSRLVLCPDTAKDQIVRQFQALGVPSARLDFFAKLPMPQYLELHNEVDIMLDCFPYNGGTVSRHSLWMGVPVLTLAGRQAVSRVGLSLMTQVGLESFVAECEADFVENACRWASELDGLAQVRGALRERMQNAPFSKHALVVKELEAAYRQMWCNWCEPQKTTP